MDGVIEDILTDSAEYFGAKMISDCNAFIYQSSNRIFEHLISEHFVGNATEELRRLVHLAAEKVVDSFSFIDEPILRDEIYGRVKYMLGENERSPYYVSKYGIICRKK